MPPEVLDVLIVGSGMIVHDQILPSLYHLQRLGRIGEVTVCARRKETLEALTAAPMLQRAFPGQSFRASLEPFAHAIRQIEPRNIVFVAVPDQLHPNRKIAGFPIAFPQRHRVNYLSC